MSSIGDVRGVDTRGLPARAVPGTLVRFITYLSEAASSDADVSEVLNAFHLDYDTTSPLADQLFPGQILENISVHDGRWLLEFDE